MKKRPQPFFSYPFGQAGGICLQECYRIGIVIADDDEYAPVLKRQKVLSMVPDANVFRQGHRFRFQNQGREIEVHTLLCGIGKVNAAAAAMALVAEGCDCLVNFGLSGGLSSVARGDFVVGTRYIEHDFDLTSLGYAPCEKPGQTYIYEADPTWLSRICRCYPFLIKGTIVTGDCFVNDPARRDFLANQFGAVACDMESAAVVAVAHLAGIPFFALRKISDDAGEAAIEDYREMNEIQSADLFEMTLSCLEAALEP